MGSGTSSVRPKESGRLSAKPSVPAVDESAKGRPYMVNNVPGYLTTRGKLYQFSHAHPTMIGADDIDPWLDDDGGCFIHRLVRVNKTFSQAEAAAEEEQNTASAHSAMRKRQGLQSGGSLTRREMELELDSDEFYQASKVQALDMINNSSVRRPLFTQDSVTRRIVPLSVEEDSKDGVGKVTRREPGAELIKVSETHTWALFNDSLDRFYLIRAVFDPSSDITGLASTVVHRGVRGEIERSQISTARQMNDTYYNNLWVAEVIVGPTETVGFIEGKVKGAYTIQSNVVNSRTSVPPRPPPTARNSAGAPVNNPFRESARLNAHQHHNNTKNSNVSEPSMADDQNADNTSNGSGLPPATTKRGLVVNSEENTSAFAAPHNTSATPPVILKSSTCKSFESNRSGGDKAKPNIPNNNNNTTNPNNQNNVHHTTRPTATPAEATTTRDQETSNVSSASVRAQGAKMASPSSSEGPQSLFTVLTNPLDNSMNIIEEDNVTIPGEDCSEDETAAVVRTHRKIA
ncbi:Domain of unknown function (DUF1935), putative [Angomonas deanei]|uniref:DUF1935 domain-containing protein n=1 Tax=Angomonas deanei TaxID=59799 RepID=A0A7G2C826_9TRYP|nr:Domain of unknown function (DUF1935), putative [Angomonas deanei]